MHWSIYVAQITKLCNPFGVNNNQLLDYNIHSRVSIMLHSRGKMGNKQWMIGWKPWFYSLTLQLKSEIPPLHHLHHKEIYWSFCWCPTCMQSHPLVPSHFPYFLPVNAFHHLLEGACDFIMVQDLDSPRVLEVGTFIWPLLNLKSHFFCHRRTTWTSS